MRTPDHRGRTRLAAAAAGLPALIAVTMLTACGPAGPSHPSTSGTSTSQAGQGPRNADYDQTEAITTCYRQHGDPGFPDPVYDPSDGNWHFAISPGTAPESTRRACQHLFPATSPSPPVSRAEFQQLLRYAQCMRQHGVPGWPDPNPAGDFALPPDLQVKTPAAEAAGTACQRYVPSGGLSVSAG